MALDLASASTSPSLCRTLTQSLSPRRAQANFTGCVRVPRCSSDLSPDPALAIAICAGDMLVQPDSPFYLQYDNEFAFVCDNVSAELSGALLRSTQWPDPGPERLLELR